jgi:hypothetical protein
MQSKKQFLVFSMLLYIFVAFIYGYYFTYRELGFEFLKFFNKGLIVSLFSTTAVLLFSYYNTYHKKT